MRRILLATTALAALAAAPAPAQQRSIKIGFVSTFSGPTAVIGNDMRNSVELALDHLGRKMGGLRVGGFSGEDRQRLGGAARKTRKLMDPDRVTFIAGSFWSNVCVAQLKRAAD